MSAIIICTVLTLSGAAAGFASAHVLARRGRERERAEARTRLSDSIREVDFLRILEGHYVREIAELRNTLGGAAGSKAEADIQQEFRTAVRDKYKLIFRSDAARTGGGQAGSPAATQGSCQAPRK